MLKLTLNEKEFPALELGPPKSQLTVFEIWGPLGDSPVTSLILWLNIITMLF